MYSQSTVDNGEAVVCQERHGEAQRNGQDTGNTKEIIDIERKEERKEIGSPFVW